MNKWILIFLVSVTVKLSAQTNAPVRLAVISESAEAMTAADVLTAQLSNNGKIQLLERDQIEKVYRELGLSAANRDDLKLGRILGADGLLLLHVVRTPQTTNLMARLIAVKPGVVLTDGSFPWPLKNTPQWAESVTAYLNAFLPKLSLLAKDAIPISIVNLRAAISSAAEKETERDLKLLTIQRLSQERRFFVLERQKMQLLGNEKELKSDESAFWDGSYLLDGIIDQSGYSPETVTINVRLTPPRGGTPLRFEVSGSRTNLAEVVNRLARKVTKLLNVHSTVPEWTAANEAAQYYDEAKWALRWGVCSEAQSAADSAWALGKHDMDCAIVRIKAYETPLHRNIFQHGEYTNPSSSNEVVQTAREEAAPNPPWGLTLREQHFGGAKDVQYVFAGIFPNPKDIATAAHALELYYRFSRNSSKDLFQVASPKSRWTNSTWYDLGIEDLIAASIVLQDFNFVPEAQKSVADQLADLRARVRSVAELISESPSVHQSYFVGNRIAVYDELVNTIGEDGGRNPNFFCCEAKWGCFWEDRPEDTIGLYRELMRSPVFRYIHKYLWLRPVERPRLVAWNAEDKKRLPQLWSAFVQELNGSTNVLWRLEAKAFQLADAKDDQKLAVTFTNLFNAILEDRKILVTNNVDILYQDWGIDDLVDAKTGNGIDSKTKESLQRLFRSQYSPKLETMEQQYRRKTVPAPKFLPTFQKQVRYLKDNTPYDFFKFADLFNGNTYSQSQAREILPLIISYKSNLVAQSKHASGMQKGKLMGAIAQVGFVEDNVDRVLHPPILRPAKTETAKIINPASSPAVRARTVPTIAQEPAGVLTNILLVKNFLKIPFNQIEDGNSNISGFLIFAHRWNGGKLLVGLQYAEAVYGFDKHGNWTTSAKPHLAIAIFTPSTGGWDMVNCPDISDIALNELKNPYMPKPANQMVLFHDSLYFNNGVSLQKYNFQKHTWQNLDIPIQSECDLFAAAGHLFATDANSILEITNNGQGMRILASTRRWPAQSTLDSLDNLGLATAFAGGRPSPPGLFSGPDHSICACIGTRVFSWDGNNWHELFTLNFSQLPEVFGTIVIFRSVPSFGPSGPGSLWIWDKNQPRPQLALHDDAKPRPGIMREPPRGFFNPLHKSSVHTVHPLWKSPIGDHLTDSAVTFYQSNLYCFVDHCIVTNVAGHWTVAEKNGYHAQLICLTHDYSGPIVVPLKFDLERGQPPLKGLGEKLEQIPWQTGPSWIHFAADALYIGQPDTPGIWEIPISEIEAAVTEQKKACLAKLSQEKERALVTVEQRQKVLARQWQELLAKYDLDHNGRIDPDEKEAALANPVFIKFELNKIDINHNDRLDAQELAWFDANHNGTLDPPEEAGIMAAQKLLAEKLVKDFDHNGDGELDQNEFTAALAQNSASGMVGQQAWVVFPMYDRNHNHELDAGELQSYLEQYTLQDVQRKIFQIEPSKHLFRFRLTHPRPTFKNLLEMYWIGMDRGDHAQPNRQQ